MEELLNLIANVGFPIAVAAYLLIRIENKLGDLTLAIGSASLLCQAGATRKAAAVYMSPVILPEARIPPALRRKLRIS
ncbi:YvrJ family protein [Syntrophomonas curvata]